MCGESENNLSMLMSSNGQDSQFSQGNFTDVDGIAEMAGQLGPPPAEVSSRVVIDRTSGPWISPTLLCLIIFSPFFRCLPSSPHLYPVLPPCSYSLLLSSQYSNCSSSRSCTFCFSFYLLLLLLYLDLCLAPPLPSLVSVLFACGWRG